MARANIYNQVLMANGILDVPIESGFHLHALLFAHTGSSDAVVTVYAIPLRRPESTKSTHKIFVKTVTAGTTDEFRVQDTEINLDGFQLQIQTDSNGAGHIMCTVIGR